MTYGSWLTRARVRLGDAVDELVRAGPGSVAEILAVTGGRAAVYRQLARHAQLLIGQQPITVKGPAFARTLRWTAFRSRLQRAADEAPVPTPVSARIAATSVVVRALISAADSLGVAGDILASHLLPSPHTPEAVAIQAGGGVASGVGELARVVVDAVAVDVAVPGWLAGADERIRLAGDPLARAVRSTTQSLPHLLAAVRAGTPPGPPLLHGLAATPAVGSARPPVHTTAEAVATVQAAGSWLWRNPGGLRAAHLRLGTQLGLAATLAGDPGNPAVALWRQAATWAAAVEGSPPIGDAAAAAHRLDDALRWTRTALDTDGRARTDRIAVSLPQLATALRGGLARAVERGELFVLRDHQAVSSDAAAGAMYRWRRARPADLDIISLGIALAELGRDRAPADPGAASRAFRRPPSPAIQAPPLPPPPMPGAIRPRVGRGR